MKLTFKKKAVSFADAAAVLPGAPYFQPWSTPPYSSTLPVSTWAVCPSSCRKSHVFTCTIDQYFTVETTGGVAKETVSVTVPLSAAPCRLSCFFHLSVSGLAFWVSQQKTKGPERSKNTLLGRVVLWASEKSGNTKILCGLTADTRSSIIQVI
uniref:uncharacterized protein LOC128929566 isoform X2 n=1 Tax=Callithrix jacchus TaxID=9483 RepID=UPI0023DD287C|nr:uncharacterized protein LOC128929566 isoform X2 [Callithrix jacchus]